MLKLIRFWGKICGQYNDYFVIETELKEEEIAKRNELKQIELNPPLPEVDANVNPLPENVEEALKVIAEEQEGEVEDTGPPKKYPRQKPPIPVSQFVEPPKVPIEFPGFGINKKTYYVCHEPGDEWIELPDATPEQIRVARIIVQEFTGNLDQDIVTYPEFPGTERNLLRAQIARISAGMTNFNNRYELKNLRQFSKIFT